MIDKQIQGVAEKIANKVISFIELKKKRKNKNDNETA